MKPESLELREPIPCKECGENVWHVNLSVCEPCFYKLYAKWGALLWQE